MPDRERERKVRQCGAAAPSGRFKSGVKSLVIQLPSLWLLTAMKMNRQRSTYIRWERKCRRIPPQQYLEESADGTEPGK